MIYYQSFREQKKRKMEGKLTNDKGQVENFTVTSKGLLSEAINEMRVKVNDRLTEYCNLEKAARGEAPPKKAKPAEDSEINE